MISTEGGSNQQVDAIGDIASSAYTTFQGIINVVLPILIGVILILGLFYGIQLAVRYAKAEEEEDKKKAKNSLTNVIVGCLVGVVFIAIIMLVLNGGYIKSLFGDGVKTDFGSTTITETVGASFEQESDALYVAEVTNDNELTLQDLFDTLSLDTSTVTLIKYGNADQTVADFDYSVTFRSLINNNTFDSGATITLNCDTTDADKNPNGIKQIVLNYAKTEETGVEKISASLT